MYVFFVFTLVFLFIKVNKFVYRKNSTVANSILDILKPTGMIESPAATRNSNENLIFLNINALHRNQTMDWPEISMVLNSAVFFL